jgi:hypothetical protein
VDEGRFGWDTPVTAVYPAFALGDPVATKRIQMQHLVCACTGLPRQDFEWLYEFNGVTASTELERLHTMKPTTDFGAVYQYSNILAAGGFIAGHAVDPHQELGAAYDDAIRSRVLGPLGMSDTTFSMDTAPALFVELRARIVADVAIIVDGRSHAEDGRCDGEPGILRELIVAEDLAELLGVTLRDLRSGRDVRRARGFARQLREDLFPRFALRRHPRGWRRQHVAVDEPAVQDRDAVADERGVAVESLDHLPARHEGVRHRGALRVHRAPPIRCCSAMFRRTVFANDATLACSRASTSIVPSSSQRTGWLKTRELWNEMGANEPSTRRTNTTSGSGTRSPFCST